MAVNNLVVASSYSNAIASLRSFQDKPEIERELYKTYGMGLMLIDFFHKSGRATPMASPTISGEEENFTHRTLDIATVVSHTDTSAVLTLDASNFDTYGNYYPRVGFSVLVGNTITGFTECRIDSIDTTAAPNTQFTIKVYDTTGAVGLNAQVTAGNLATGVSLPIGASAFGAGTDQPKATNVGTVQRTFNAQILKESLGFEGRTLTQQKWIPVNGGSLFFNRELARAEFLLEAQEEMMCIMGQDNTANLTQTSLVSGAANQIGKTKGVYTWIKQLGGDLTIGSTGMSVDDLDSIEDYLVQNGLQESVVALYGGHKALQKLMNNVTAKIQGTSGGLAGSPYVNDVQDRLFGGKTISANFNVQYIKRSSVTFVLIPSPIFSNPKFLGVSTTLLDDAIIVIPLNMATVSIDHNKVTIPNLMKRYIAMDGISRERIVGNLTGMDGLNQQIGTPIISSIDGSNCYWLSDVCFTYFESWKGMIVRRSA